MIDTHRNHPGVPGRLAFTFVPSNSSAGRGGGRIDHASAAAFGHYDPTNATDDRPSYLRYARHEEQEPERVGRVLADDGAAAASANIVTELLGTVRNFVGEAVIRQGGTVVPAGEDHLCQKWTVPKPETGEGRPRGQR
jgi:hypothetical protein